MRKVILLMYNNRSGFSANLNAKDAACHSAPSRTILTIASKEQRSVFQYSYTPRKSQLDNVRVSIGGAQ